MLECFKFDSRLGLPKQFIILRHAEETDTGGFALLARVGRMRWWRSISARAQRILFVSGEPPAAFYAITGHTKETIEPAANTWPGVPLRSPAKFTKRNFQMTGRTNGPRCWKGSSYKLRRQDCCDGLGAPWHRRRGQFRISELCATSSASINLRTTGRRTGAAELRLLLDRRLRSRRQI